MFQVPRRRVPALIRAVAWLLVCASTQWADGITGFTVTNISNPNFTHPDGSLFVSSAGSLGVVNNPDSATAIGTIYYQNQAQSLDMIGNSQSVFPRYEMTFTVEDPTNRGYSLSLGIISTATIQATLETVALPGKGPIGAEGRATTMASLLDEGSGYDLLPATFFVPSDTLLLTEVGDDSRYFTRLVPNTVFGNFTGTRTFGLRFHAGLLPGSTATLYEGSLGDVRIDANHSAQVSVQYNDPSAVPEPATWATLGVVLVVLAGARGWRRVNPHCGARLPPTPRPRA